MSVTPSSPRRQTADEFARQCRTESTKRAYAADWRDFNGWCQANGETALPARPVTIGRYLADRAATHRPQTLKRHLAAIIIHHRQAGHAIDRRDPAIADVLRGINRTIGTAPVQKDPLLAEDIRQLVAAQPTSLTGLRDCAVLLLGFSGAFRRSELAALTTRDLVWTSDGLAVKIRRAKDDQEAQGHLKAIPFGSCEATCPVRAVRRWIMTARLSDGPLFRRIDRFGNLHAVGISG
jgi:site-specific recombinase XerD